MEPWDVSAEHVAQVLRFNRFYEDRIVAESDAMRINEMTWTQWRVLRELGESPNGSTAAWLRQRLRVDAGHLCRIIKLFGDHDFVRTRPWSIDSRVQDIELTERGRTTFEGLERFCKEYVNAILENLTRGEQRRLLQAMRAIEDVLTPGPYVLKYRRREPRD